MPIGLMIVDAMDAKRSLKTKTVPRRSTIAPANQPFSR
jgi:hypothetical protein